MTIVTFCHGKNVTNPNGNVGLWGGKSIGRLVSGRLGIGEWRVAISSHPPFFCHLRARKKEYPKLNKKKTLITNIPLESTISPLL